MYVYILFSWISEGKRVSLPLRPPGSVLKYAHVRACGIIANGFCCLALTGLCTEMLQSAAGAAVAPPEPAGCCAGGRGTAWRSVRERLRADLQRGWKSGWLCPGGGRTCL